MSTVGKKINFVNFSQLRSFYAVAREKSVTKAANLLNIGQPTVTTQVKGLEETFGIQLFNRTPRSITMTSEGERLYELARQIFSLEEQAVELLLSHSTSVAGKLRIGTVGPFFVMDILGQLYKDYPLIQIFLESGNSEQIYEKLLNYEVDVAITGSRISDPRLEQIKLGSHEVVLLINSDHAWAQRVSININECDGQRIIMRETGSMTRRKFEETLQAAAIRPNVVMELSRDALREAVRAGFGVGITSIDEMVPDRDLHYVRIADNPPVTESYAICLKERKSVRGVKLFMDLVKNAVVE
ncbi:LysR substrate-binding domain-containing protein [Yoonia sp.]|uniref:LysR substrate-binding domain-containing protein n=1 Tax=Yoonia sp. TaxID=2212373 RepID=UPI002DFB584F|nr:LysR substrate-binding domain-containing protein [Yoonia sp.]